MAAAPPQCQTHAHIANLKNELTDGLTLPNPDTTIEYAGSIRCLLPLAPLHLGLGPRLLLTLAATEPSARIDDSLHGLYCITRFTAESATRVHQPCGTPGTARSPRRRTQPPAQDIAAARVVVAGVHLGRATDMRDDAPAQLVNAAQVLRQALQEPPATLQLRARSKLLLRQTFYGTSVLAANKR